MEKKDKKTSHFWKSLTRKRRDLRKLVVKGSDECPELYDGILSQAENTAHFLGLEYVQKKVKEFLKKCPFHPNVSRGIVEDIFGESGLGECESEQDFTSKLRQKFIKWDSTEALYSKLHPQNRFVNYFQKHKAEKIKSTLEYQRSTYSKVSFTGDYRQNYIERTHYMAKFEIDAENSDAHKTMQILEAVVKLKHDICECMERGC